MTFALLPAGGKSVRMGRPKLSLPLGGRTVVESVLAGLRDGGVSETLVVVAPDLAEVARLAEAAGARVLRLAHETADMRATVEQGLTWLEQTLRPRPGDDWLLAPADHPTLDGGVVRALRRAFADDPGHSIFVPTFRGKRGHPALLAWRHVAGVRAHPPGLGLNTYLRQQTSETWEVPVETPDILLDLDTPEDYECLLRRFAGRAANR